MLLLLAPTLALLPRNPLQPSRDLHLWACLMVGSLQAGPLLQPAVAHLSVLEPPRLLVHLALLISLHLFLRLLLPPPLTLPALSAAVLLVLWA